MEWRVNEWRLPIPLMIRVIGTTWPKPCSDLTVTHWDIGTSHFRLISLCRYNMLNCFGRLEDEFWGTVCVAVVQETSGFYGQQQPAHTWVFSVWAPFSGGSRPGMSRIKPDKSCSFSECNWGSHKTPLLKGCCLPCMANVCAFLSKNVSGHELAEPLEHAGFLNVWCSCDRSDPISVSGSDLDAIDRSDMGLRIHLANPIISVAYSLHTCVLNNHK